jgi:VanZ family protein
MSDNRMQSLFHRKWLVVSLLSLIGLLILTHIPHEALPKVLQRNLLDKVQHVVAYGVIAFLYLQSLREPIRPTVAAAGLLVLAGIGILDEATQPLVNRHACVWDFVADVTGIGLAALVFLVKRRFMGRTEDERR